MNYNLSSLGSSSCKYINCQFHANWSDRLSYKDHVGITAIILLSMYMYIITCNNTSILKPHTSSKYAFKCDISFFCLLAH